MTYNKSALAVAIAATVGGASTAADAAVHNVKLVSISNYSNNGSAAANVASTTATFQYDDVTNLLTQTGGVLEDRTNIAPTITLFRHTITGLVIGNGGAASASAYTCTTGNFGDITGAHLCGNYNFGANFADESTVSYGPGTAFARTIGGDDMISEGGVGLQQSIAQLNGFTTTSFVGSVLMMKNSTTCGTCSSPNVGYDWVLSTNTADTDADGVPDVVDNCRTIANNTGAGAQADSDIDGFGNRCDGDMNNNGATNAQDTSMFRTFLGAASVNPVDHKADLNAHGAVNAQDTSIFRTLLGSAPGPGKAAP
jgi:hypothetical protein